jgi:hypothetical protein
MARLRLPAGRRCKEQEKRAEAHDINFAASGRSLKKAAFDFEEDPYKSRILVKPGWVMTWPFLPKFSQTCMQGDVHSLRIGGCVWILRKIRASCCSRFSRQRTGPADQLLRSIVGEGNVMTQALQPFVRRNLEGAPGATFL